MTKKPKSRIVELAPIIGPIIGGVFVIVAALIPILFGQNTQRPASIGSSSTLVQSTQQVGTPAINSNTGQVSQPQMLVLPFQSLLTTLVTIMGVLFLLTSLLSLWATRPGLAILRKLFGYNSTERAYRFARLEALDGNLRTAVSWVRFAAKSDPLIIDRVARDVAFEKMREDVRYKAYLQDRQDSEGTPLLHGSNLGKGGKIGGQSKNSELELIPRDFGLDAKGCRRIGFQIENQSEKLDVRLKMFWCSGENKPDEMQLRYWLNLTSFNLKQTSDGQFFLAIAWLHGPFNFSLVLDDGYYGLFSVAGYYKARVSISRKGETDKTCYDALIAYKGRATIELIEIQRVDCDDSLDNISDKADDHGSENWSTVEEFQPNSMYKNN